MGAPGGAREIRLVEVIAQRWDLLGNKEFLERRAAASDAPAWFGSLYLWLNLNPVYEEDFYYKPRKRLKTYHDVDFILTRQT